MKKILFFALFLIPLLAFSSCSSTLRCREEYINSYYQGNFSQTESRLTQQICKEMPDEDFQSSPDAVWLLLDRATTRFAMDNVDSAIVDYKKAIDAMDFYSHELTSESTSKLLLQDETGAYIAEDFEQILARLYFALALLHQDDESNALALLRQAEELQQQKREDYANDPLTNCYQLVDNAVSKYLFALLLERKGDLSNASLLYQQAEALACQTLDNTPSPNSATILLVCHNGNAPQKISVVTDASVASLVALEIFLDATDVPPSASALGGIPVPALSDSLTSQPIPTFACLDGQQQLLTSWYNIKTVAQQQLDQKMPIIAARSLARYLLRRSAIAIAKSQNCDLGAFVDLGFLIANLATKADTRSWSKLPSSIDLARYDTTPATHQLTLKTSSGQEQHFTLNLNPNDLCIVNIFNIQPGITKILVPKRFLKHKEPNS